MFNRSLGSLLLACFAGAVIGAFVALSLFLKWFALPIGIIVGGGMAYIVCDFKEIIQAVPRAWRKAVSWKPDKKFILFLWCWPAISMAILSFVFLFEGLILFSGAGNLVVASFVFFNIVIPLTFGAFISIMVASDSNESYFSEDKRKVKNVMLRGNPIAVFIVWPIVGLYLAIKHSPTILKHIPMILKKSATAIAIAMLALSRFLKYLYIAIHSSRRVIAMISAAIGTVIGYFAGNPLFGGGVAVVVGLIEHELLAKRVLGIVPNGGTA